MIGLTKKPIYKDFRLPKFELFIYVSQYIIEIRKTWIRGYELRLPDIP